MAVKRMFFSLIFSLMLLIISFGYGWAEGTAYPIPPYNLRIMYPTHVGATSTSLTWEKGSEEVQSYILEKRSADQKDYIVQGVFDGKRCTVEGLKPCCTYYFRVCAEGKQGRSGYSNELCITTDPVITVLSPDKGAQLAAREQYTIRWKLEGEEIEKLNLQGIQAILSYSYEDKDVAAIREGGLTQKINSEFVGIGEGSYTWKVPDISKTIGSARISVCFCRPVTYTSSGKSIICGTGTSLSLIPQKQATAQEKRVLRFKLGKLTYMDGVDEKRMDSAPVLKGDRVFLPIRFAAEALGGQVSWDASQEMVTISLEKKTIKLWMNRYGASVDGNAVFIDSKNLQVVPFSSSEGRMMVPLRFIAESLGNQVEWIPETGEILIHSYNR